MITYRGLGGVDGVVAGSKHFFSLENGKSIETVLHDCGSAMGGGENPINRTRLPFDSRRLNAVVVSHGHFDHAGEVYRPYINGYSRFIFCHDATGDLIKIDLEQLASNEINRVANYNRKIAGKKDEHGKYIPFTKPGFEPRQARHISGMIQGMKYGITVEIAPNIKLTLHDAGHIIGSSQCLYEFKDSKTGKTTKVLTCADLGRSDVDVPIVRPPWTHFPNDIDYCFIESTYGERKHADKQESREELEEALMRGIKEKRRMLIGAFSIMRTHSVLSDLFWTYKRGKLPSDFKIYLDSPSALRVNQIILKHPECIDEQARRDFFDDSKENPFRFPNLKIIHSKEDSEGLDTMRQGPYVIISASGMWFMGRIVRHLRSHISDPNSLLMQTGYQIPGCTGWQIEQGKEKFPKIKIADELLDYNAESMRLKGYGAHADGDECVKHVTKFVKPRRKTFVVHGEKASSEWTRAQLEKRGFPAEIVRLNNSYQLN